MPKRIQLRRTKGWRKPEGAIVVARPSKWGNPFTVAEFGRQEAVALHRRFVTEGRCGWHHGHFICPPTPKELQELRDHDLACWCAPAQPCHADVLLEIANAEENARG